MGTKRISLSSIDIEDQKYQVRDHRSVQWGAKVIHQDASKNHIKQMVNDLKYSNAKFPLIQVLNEPEGSDRYVIFDGFHRCSAYIKVNKDTGGKRFKQITVEVVGPETVNDRLLEINTEHKALTLQPAHRTELTWQKFLKLEKSNASLSKKELAERLSASTSTIGNWRKLVKQFTEAGLFKDDSPVEKNISTNYPILVQAKKWIKDQEYRDYESEGLDDYLIEEDKKVLEKILKLALTAKEKDKLLDFVNENWGKNPKYVLYDEALDSGLVTSPEGGTEAF
ncbi:ParB N-terminal domain-containing protein [Salinimonas lutimaris]|uniref:ParB N-terminal domain-containing protein n=1 Tax=Salinimonas lutimaris TaxID=914153 RepID=UPI0010C08DF2|nr:ParB N-terminal domain-containing protein [Salinimonas lutimaris]